VKQVPAAPGPARMLPPGEGTALPVPAKKRLRAGGEMARVLWFFSTVVNVRQRSGSGRGPCATSTDAQLAHPADRRKPQIEVG